MRALKEAELKMTFSRALQKAKRQSGIRFVVHNLPDVERRLGCLARHCNQHDQHRIRLTSEHKAYEVAVSADLLPRGQYAGAPIIVVLEGERQRIDPALEFIKL